MADRDTASGFGATAESNDNQQQINNLLDQVRDLLAEDGVDYATAEALTNFARRGSAPIVGNLADLQRLGAIAVEGQIPANAMPTGDQASIETSNIQDAFAEPPAPATAQAGPQIRSGNTGGNGGNLDSMTKAELEAEASRRGVNVSSSMTKQEMIDAINAG